MLWERELYFRGESQNEGFGGAGSGSLGRAAAESASAAWRRRRPKLRRRRAPCGGGGGCEGWGPARRQSGARPPRRLQRGLGTRSASSRHRWESTCRPHDRTGGEARASPEATEDGARPGVSPAAPAPARGTGPAAPRPSDTAPGDGRGSAPLQRGAVAGALGSGQRTGSWVRGLHPWGRGERGASR